eukprot:GHRR01000257.1.p1 GENE.GHRR01000257.1~~GHRR01000257.1.p1  ORF type:complete len:250 (+),score=87.65 GHRR01000257.1:241-990(+)
MICQTSIPCTPQASACRRNPLSSAAVPAGHLAKHCNGGCSSSCRKACTKLFQSPASKPMNRADILAPAEAVAIYYSTATGKTQEVADVIKDALGDAANEPVDIGDVEDITTALTDSSLDGLIVGAPTWNTGADEGRSGTAWDDVVATIKGLNLKGRKVAVFGCGDQHSYGDYYCDAMEEIYSSFKAAGADLVGKWSTEGYEHSESKAEIEPGFFCGLALDQDNQDDLTEGRIAKWTAQILKEMNVKVAA